MADDGTNLGTIHLSTPLQRSLFSLVLGVHLIYAVPVHDGTSDQIRDIGGGGFEIALFEKNLQVALPGGHVGGERSVGQLPKASLGSPPASQSVLTEYIKQGKISIDLVFLHL